MRDVDALHDAYVAAARRFRQAPSFAQAHEVAGAYRRFYIAFIGQDGLDIALAELRQRCAREVARVAVAA